MRDLAGPFTHLEPGCPHQMKEPPTEDQAIIDAAEMRQIVEIVEAASAGHLSARVPLTRGTPPPDLLGALRVTINHLLNTVEERLDAPQGGRNQQTEKLFGYSRNELIGQPVEMLVPERFRGRHPGHRANYASNQPEDVLLGFNLGLNAYVRKQVDFVEFADAARVIATFWLRLNEPPPKGDLP